MGFTYDAVTNTFHGNSHYSQEMGQVMWHITDRCPLDCAICFTKKMRSRQMELPREYVPEIVCLLAELNVRKIDITGGEPLLYDALPELVRQCAEKQIAVTFTTSGCGDQVIREWTAKHWRSFSRVILSLDGPADIHNELRGSKIAYEGFTNFMHLLKNEGCENSRINTVLTKKCLGNASEFAELIKRLKPWEWCIIMPFPINKTDAYDKLNISIREYMEFCEECESVLDGSGISITYRTNEDYGSYWALYPDGYLYYSQDNESYGTKIQLREENIEKIRSLVMMRAQKYIILDR